MTSRSSFASGRPRARSPTPLPHEAAAAWVRAAAGGDREAFAKLYAAYAPVVHGVLLARVSPSDADDLVQDVFVTAMNKLHTLDEPRSVGRWLTTIARRRATDLVRARRKTTDVTDVGEADPRRAEAEQVLRTIRGLPEAYRETLVMRLVEGMTGPEIADRTGLTPESVRVNLHRGMKLLRAALDDGGES